MESQEGRRLHGLAAQAREAGDSIKALELTEQAMAAYQDDGDKLGFAELQSERFLSLRHLYEKTEDKGYLILAKHAAMASVELAQAADQLEALAIPFFNLAKAQETLGELEEAVTSYRQAVEHITNHPPPNHNRPAVVADFNVHLATCEYRAGDKSALDRALQALADLENSAEPDYNKKVWISGGHMRLAEVLREDDLPSAKQHLEQAKEIIDSDDRLKLRLNQWKKLSQQFS